MIREVGRGHIWSRKERKQAGSDLKGVSVRLFDWMKEEKHPIIMAGEG